MAQGNPMNGMLRGRIGDTVFSRKRGVQQSRAYRRDPYNPQTTSQNGQRVKFGTAARFYARGVKNLFKFAYEFKRSGESDYNAFLRYNLGSVVPTAREAYNGGAPCIGEWVMADGSLPTISLDMEVDELRNDRPGLYTGENFGEGCDNTLGALSRALIKHYGVENRDIITIVDIFANQVCVESFDEAVAKNALTTWGDSEPSVWTIKQFLLDVDSQLPIEDMDIFGFCTQAHNYLTLPWAKAVDIEHAHAACVIVSRPQRRGLKVSHSVLQPTWSTQEAIRIGQLEEWWRYCAESFTSAKSLDNIPENILEGSIAAGEAAQQLAISPDLPIALRKDGTGKPSQSIAVVKILLTKTPASRLVFEVDTEAIEYVRPEVIDNKIYFHFGSTSSFAQFWLAQDTGELYATANADGRMLTKIYLSLS